MAAIAFGQVEHDDGALDLIRGLRTIAAQLCDHGTQCSARGATSEAIHMRVIS